MSDENQKNGSNRQNENSVLMSLKALRVIEADRLETEAEQQRQQDAAEQQARQRAEQLTREAADRKRQATLAAARLAEEADRREAQDAEIRVLAANSAARIEAAARLETQKMQLELASGSRSSNRWAMPVALTAALLLLGAGAYVLAIYLPNQQRERDAASAARIQAARDALADQKKHARHLASLKEAMTARADRITKLKGEVSTLRKELAERESLAAKASKGKAKGRKGRLVAQAGSKVVRGGRRPRGKGIKGGRRPKGPSGGKVKRPDKSCKNNPLCYLFQD